MFDKGLLIVLFLVTLLCSLTFGNHVANDIRSGNTLIRGVNLGGWLVIEHSMTGCSDLWKGISDTVSDGGEYIVMKHLGHKEGDKRFKQHRDTWITEKDIAEISSQGLNAVRVPVGFWITEFDKNGLEEYKMYAPGSLKYLDVLVKDWALKHNIGVFVDLHAVVGSQNGFDHSAPKKVKEATWSNQTKHIDSTLDVVEFILNRYKDEPSFLGFGCINEPHLTTSQNILKSYFLRVYDLMRDKLGSDHVMGTSPLLQQQDVHKSDWDRFMVSEEYKNVVHEWHKYQIWGFEDMDEDDVLDYIKNHLTNSVTKWKGNKLLIGEWNFGTTSKATFEDRDRWNVFSNNLLDVYNHVHWTYWSWRVCGDETGKQTWSMRNMLRGGWFPKLN